MSPKLLCEVGGHKQGLPAGCIKADCVVGGALTKDEYGTHAEQAYMSIWHNTGDSHPGGTSHVEPSLSGTASVSQPSARVAASAAAQEDSGMKNIASVSQPSVRDTASAAPSTNVGKTMNRQTTRKTVRFILVCPAHDATFKVGIIFPMLAIARAEPS